MSRLKTKTKTDILATLKGFEVGDTEFFKFSDCGTDARTFAARYHKLRHDGLIQGEFHFFRVAKPRGVVIVRTE